ncbi:MAG: type II toxin-antitoxin system VapC family toxin [Rhodospirillales bacterium]
MLDAPLPEGIYFASVITEMELLCHPALDNESRQLIESFLGKLTLVELTPAIRSAAVDLRRRHGLKLPDAIIAATAQEYAATLLSHDIKMTKISGVNCLAMPLKPR